MKETQKYLYIINYTEEDKDICLLELKFLFKKNILNKNFILEDEIDPSISPYIRARLEIIYSNENFNEIVNQIKNSKFSAEEYKVEYLKTDNFDLDHKERLEKVKEIGSTILGNFKMNNPKELFFLSFFENKWFFGRGIKNDFSWNEHVNKPCSYSNSLSVKLARSLVNIASEGNKELSIIDPCCGVGTVVVEGKFLGLNIVGSDINKKIVEGANINLEHFGFEKIIKVQDIKTINQNYDAAILDIPYGIFSHTSSEEQSDLIKYIRNFSKKMVLISFENLEKMIQKNNFSIIAQCKVLKGKFCRYIYVCK